MYLKDLNLEFIDNSNKWEIAHSKSASSFDEIASWVDDMAARGPGSIKHISHACGFNGSSMIYTCILILQTTINPNPQPSKENASTMA